MNEFLKSILVGINSIIGNYGWSVVVFTLLIRLILFPFDYKSRSSMRKTQKLQPEIARLQKKYANDQEKLNRKLSELYKKEHINPISSCLPMLITLPILYAMFAAMRLVANEQMVAQVFDMLQGKQPVLEGWLWIKNVWMPDSPFSACLPDYNSLRAITDTNIWQSAFAALGDNVANLPEALALTADSFTSANLQTTIQAIYNTLETMPSYVEATSALPGWTFNLWVTTVNIMKDYNGFYILPVMSALTQYLMTKMQPTQQPTAADSAQQQQAAASSNFMKWFFPLFSLWICSGYSAMFAIYWVASNVIAALQTLGINWYLDRKEKKTADVAGEGSVK
jgi:YidC/Oxa1 family membrane protein insertase